MQQIQPIQIPLEISYEIALKGGLQELTIYNQKFAFEIPKGIVEGTCYELQNVLDPSTNTMHVIWVVVKYEQNQHYGREGNNLTGCFTFSKDHDGIEFIPDYPIHNELTVIRILKQQTYVFENKGFYDELSQTTGNYILTIYLI